MSKYRLVLKLFFKKSYEPPKGMWWLESRFGVVGTSRALEHDFPSVDSVWMMNSMGLILGWGKALGKGL